MLRVSRLSKNFGGLRALHELDFQVERGMIYSIIGPNGAGKSTLFNLIAGIYWPTSGEIEFEDRPITKMPPYRLASLGVARTFQTASYFSEKTLEENLLTARHVRQQAKLWDILARNALYRREEAEIRQKAETVINFLNIRKYRNQAAKEIPTAVKQLLAIGMALMTEPRILLLDEPCGGMTVEEVEHLMVLIKKMRDQDITVLLIEHRMRMVMGISDRIMVLNFGEKIAEGTPSETRKDRAVIEAYLGQEYAV